MDTSFEQGLAVPLPPGLALVQTERGLALQGDGMELVADFSAMARRLRPQNLAHELLVRAAKLKGTASPLVVDATCGLGEDAMLLAASGCRVEAYESDPVIGALLGDALERALQDPVTADSVGRISLHREDSIGALSAMEEAPDVVYLDPMFPARTKSAAVKKKFQLLHHLEAPCANEEELLEAAVAAKPRKVVVKRPIKAPVLAGRRPSYSLEGKAIRYDVIAL